MITRRKFIGSLAGSVSLIDAFTHQASASGRPVNNGVEIRPYEWKGPYAEFRTARKMPHDWRLCADVRARWMRPGERIIIRSCETVGYETGVLYDDHIPPSEAARRNATYHHIPFTWKVERPNQALSADCVVPGKGKFWLRLRAHEDFLDIHLGVRNNLPQPMGNIDWGFCVVGFESPQIGDPTLKRTYLFDGERLCSLAELGGGPICKVYKVAGSHGFVSIGNRGLPPGPVEAKASVVIVESVDGRRSAALGFAQSYNIYSNALGNRCFHAEPYLGPLTQRGEERTMRGKLYLLAGTAQEAFERYAREFAVRD